MEVDGPAATDRGKPREVRAGTADARRREDADVDAMI